MKTDVRAICGPRVIGNIFGHYGHTVPEGRWVLVEYGEYSNGGYGPSQALKGLYDSEEAAWAAWEAAGHERPQEAHRG